MTHISLVPLKGQVTTYCPPSSIMKVLEVEYNFALIFSSESPHQ